MCCVADTIWIVDDEREKDREIKGGERFVMRVIRNNKRVSSSGNSNKVRNDAEKKKNENNKWYGTVCCFVKRA